MLKNFLEKVKKKGPAGRKRWDRKGNRTRQKNERGDSKVESNESPEIPDRGGDIRHPRPPFGGEEEKGWLCSARRRRKMLNLFKKKKKKVDIVQQGQEKSWLCSRRRREKKVDFVQEEEEKDWFRSARRSLTLFSKKEEVDFVREEEEFTYLAGALSPVNYNGLH